MEKQRYILTQGEISFNSERILIKDKAKTVSNFNCNICSVDIFWNNINIALSENRR